MMVIISVSDSNH